MRSPRLRLAIAGAAVGFLVAACGGSSTSAADVPPLPAATTASVETAIADAGTAVVLNVWASWCIPCRSEAPLLAAASETFAGGVAFIGLNVRDSQDGARSFIAEFFPEAPITHLADAPGNIPLDLGASRAVPITIFYRTDGTLSRIHTGVLDERTLSLEIDEALANRDG